MTLSLNRIALALAITATVGLTACKTEVHDAQWYLDHSDQLSKKLDECKTNPNAANDAECAAASEAFMRWYAASGQATQQDAATQGVDARLEPPAADATVPATAPTMDPSAAPATDPAAAPATDPAATDPNAQPAPAPAQGQ